MVVKVSWKRLALILVVVAAVAFAVVGYFLYFGVQHDLAEISKQSPTVQSYLEQHPNAEYEVTKCYLTGDGRVYAVDEDWKLKEFRGSAGGEPMDGKDHYCWLVGWHDPTSMIEHIVDVFIDKDVLEIVLVTEAW